MLEVKNVIQIEITKSIQQHDFNFIFFFCFGLPLYHSYLLGGFTYFKGCSTRAKVGQSNYAICYGNLRSRRISAGEGWKCLQFWYYLGSIGHTYLDVNIVSNNTKRLAWTSTAHKNNDGIWSYARFAIDSMSKSYEVSTIDYEAVWLKVLTLTCFFFFFQYCRFNGSCLQETRYFMGAIISANSNVRKMSVNEIGIM